MSTAVKDNVQTKTVAPPDEKFWKKYSPHYEFPLGSTTSLVLHGLVLGILILGGYLFRLSRESATHRPPNMDVVMLDGTGDGEAGAGAAPGLPGAPTEMAADLNTKAGSANPVPEVTTPQAIPSQEFQIPEIDLSVSKVDIDSALAKIGQEAENQAKKPDPISSSTKIAVPGVGTAGSGTGNPKGQGGQGGS